MGYVLARTIGRKWEERWPQGCIGGSGFLVWDGVLSQLLHVAVETGLPEETVDS